MLQNYLQKVLIFYLKSVYNSHKIISQTRIEISKNRNHWSEFDRINQGHFWFVFLDQIKSFP